MIAIAPPRWAPSRRSLAAGLGALALLAAGPAMAQQRDAVRFGTNWVAQAEHGGFYQAVADGTYARYGLDVTIVPGGPQVNNRLLLAAGKLDFYLGGNLIQAFNAVAQNVPTVVIAGIFQKEPQVLLAHPKQDIDDFGDLRAAPIYVSKDGVATYYQWLKQAHGFTDAQVRPYTFNLQPFLADKKSAVQGYVTSEPFAIEKQGQFRPKIFLLADYGFDTYGATIDTRRDLIEEKPDLVARFVDASIIGWYNYLYGDNKPGNALIKQQNPEMTDALLAHALEKMKSYGIVDSGAALTDGIGAMNADRIAGFFDKMAKAGVVDSNVDFRRAFTLRFVNKGVGLDLRPATTPKN